MTGHQNIIDALAELGETPDAVANKLIDLNCTGWREEGAACPVYHYLTDIKRIERIERVVADEVWIGDEPINPLDLPEERVALPAAVGEFVNQFDRGAWPVLERGGRP